MDGSAGGDNARRGADGGPGGAEAAPSYSARDYWGDDVVFPALAGPESWPAGGGVPDGSEALEPALARMLDQMRAEVRDRAAQWLQSLGPEDGAFLSAALPADPGLPEGGPPAPPPAAVPAEAGAPEAPRPRPLALPGLESLAAAGPTSARRPRRV